MSKIANTLTLKLPDRGLGTYNAYLRSNKIAAVSRE